MDVGTISGKAELRQKVKLSSPGTHTITGEIEFQVCDDVTCLPPKYDEFSFTVTVGGWGIESVTVEFNQHSDIGGVCITGDRLRQKSQQVNLPRPSLSQADADPESSVAVAGVPAMEDEKVALGIFLAGIWTGTAGIAYTLCVSHDSHDRQFLYAGR